MPSARVRRKKAVRITNRAAGRARIGASLRASIPGAALRDRIGRARRVRAIRVGKVSSTTDSRALIAPREDREMQPALLLHTEESCLNPGDPLLSFRLSVVALGDDGEIRNYDGDGATADADGLAFGDLVIQAQLDLIVGKSVGRSEPYGWKAEYSQPYNVDLRRARAMAKTLGRIERGLARRDETDGYAETFAMFAIRVARIIGADQFGWSRGAPTGDYRTGDYCWTDAGGLIGELRSRTVAFLREHGEESA